MLQCVVRGPVDDNDDVVVVVAAVVVAVGDIDAHMMRCLGEQESLSCPVHLHCDDQHPC